MSSCSYLLLKSEFDSLKQNDPDFQKLLAIYEPGKPKNKSEYGFMMDMLTLQSATKNDKMMRKKSRIAAQYNGTYTKNEPITDRLAKVEDLIDEMEKAGCGYGLGAYAAQQKAKQQPTTQKTSQPTANVKAKTIIDCLAEAIDLLKRNKKINLLLQQCEVTQLPDMTFTTSSSYGAWATPPRIMKIDVAYFPENSVQCNLSFDFNVDLVEHESSIDKMLNLYKTDFSNTEKQTLRFAFIFTEALKRMRGKYDRLSTEVRLSASFQTF